MRSLLDETALQELVETRRHLHQYPELSFHEFGTRDLIASRLRRVGIEPEIVADTGVIATMDSGRPGPVIAFRADMDALPLNEPTGSPFASAVAGVMHACGHDAHVAILLAVVDHLASRVEELSGKVRFIFEPGEETNGGALRMIEGGALNSVDSIYAIHVLPDIPAGLVGVKSGALTATDDEFTVTVHGRTAHSSAPNDGVNAILVASSIVSAIHAIPGTGVDPFDVATVSVCTIQGGDAINVVPAEVALSGMIRCVDKVTKQSIRQQIESVADNMARAYGGTATTDFVAGYPAVVNDDNCTGIARAAAIHVAGQSGVLEISKPHLGSEDFSHFQEVVPGCLVVLGCGFEDGTGGGLHAADMAFDEACLPVGAELLIRIALGQ